MEIIENVQRCNDCFASVYNGAQHNCDHNREVTSFRTPVYVNPPSPLFDFQLLGNLYYLNLESGQFEMFERAQKLICPATDGVFSVFLKNNVSAASYKATSIKNFSIIFAKMQANNCQLLFRASISSNYGLQFSELNSELHFTNDRFDIPNQYRMNTAMILAIKSKSTKIDFLVFANSTGLIETENFNGYSTTCFVNCLPTFQVNSKLQIELNWQKKVISNISF